jgi:hypothetical protein
MFLSVLLYVGLAVAFAGVVSILIPLRFLGISTRRLGLVIAAVGASGAVIIAFLPPSQKHIARRETRLDDFMPRWQFGETHSIAVAAPPAKVFESIHAVTAEDIRFFRTLTAIRRGGRSGPEGILNAPEKQPILDVATQTTFVWLADEPPREMVVGTVIIAPRVRRAGAKLTPGLFTRTLPPGVALATMNFLVRDDGRGGSIVSTETRVFANDRSSERRFAPYWRLIRPGSDIIRRMWLRAVRGRAEKR